MARTIRTDSAREITVHRAKSRRITAAEAREMHRIMAATIAFDVPASGTWLEIA